MHETNQKIRCEILNKVCHPWRRQWQPTPVFLPGESQGRGAWWAAVCGAAQSRTRLQRLSSSSHPFRLTCQLRCKTCAHGHMKQWGETRVSSIVAANQVKIYRTVSMRSMPQDEFLHILSLTHAIRAGSSITHFIWFLD